ncbi:aspartate racemase [Dyella jiangningensis]|uniref:aspartate/glutamate racemase family protein n=2 Tax=Gammaproteobacteria TaxID=1236 RepID=UPI000884D8C0|nr:aspartate/glutamate racemase family protein [Dyella sp. AtDHG13]PXV58338.1 aspartate racemase [Dyella sp. AtDHG13]SDK06555.1 aspartate racemase [Dyella jiangningensis]
MRTIGVIGGMSWESSALYYQWINRGVRDRCGPLHSARLLLDSLDFSQIAHWQREGDWDAAGEALAASARRLEAGGAECIVLATNTMHKVAAAITVATDLPFLHIADPTGAAIRRQGMDNVLLLGTAFTMNEDFYRSRLREKHGVHCLLPGEQDRAQVHRIIYEELCAGVTTETSRDTYRRIVAAAQAEGAQGVILGCTEIGLLLRQDDSPLPLFDTAALHAQAAVEFALGDVA